MDNPEEASGVRRYRVSFEIGTGLLGTALDLLTRETQAPTAAPSSEGRYKVVFLGTLSQSLNALQAIGEAVEKLVVAPEDDRPSPSVQRFASVKPHMPYTVPANVQVKKLPMKRTRVKGGAKPSERNSGRLALSSMVDGQTYYTADFHDLFVEAGFNKTSVSAVLGALCGEGKIKRVGHSAYRLNYTKETVTKPVTTNSGGASE